MEREEQKRKSANLSRFLAHRIRKIHKYESNEVAHCDIIFIGISIKDWNVESKNWRRHFAFILKGPINLCRFCTMQSQFNNSSTFWFFVRMCVSVCVCVSFSCLFQRLSSSWSHKLYFVSFSTSSFLLWEHSKMAKENEDDGKLCVFILNGLNFIFFFVHFTFMFGSGRNIHIIERHNENFALFSFKNDRIGDFAVALRSIKILISLSSQQKAVVATVVRCRFVYWFVCDRVLSSFCLCVYVLALLHRSFYSASVNIISRWTILNLWNNWNTVKLLNISSISNEKQFKLTFDFSLKSKWIGQSRNMLVRRMGDRKSGNYSQWNMWLNGILQQCNFNINDHDCLISKFPFWKFNHNFLSVRKKWTKSILERFEKSSSMTCKMNTSHRIMHTSSIDTTDTTT